MTALAADRRTPERDLRDSSYPVAAAAKIYSGALVFLNATGFAEPASTAAAKIVAGVARENIDNTGLGDGAKRVTVRRNGAFKFVNGDVIVQADIGKTAYATDDQTISKGAAGKSPVGVIIEVEADGVWVHVSPMTPADPANPDTASGVVATVEAELNEVKATLRRQGMITA